MTLGRARSWIGRGSDGPGGVGGRPAPVACLGAVGWREGAPPAAKGQQAAGAWEGSVGWCVG